MLAEKNMGMSCIIKVKASILPRDLFLEFVEYVRIFYLLFRFRFLLLKIHLDG